MKDNHSNDESIKIVTAAAVTLAMGKGGGMLAEKLTDESINTYHQLTQSLHQHIRSHV